MSNSISLFVVFLSESVSAFTGYIASRVSQRQQQRRNTYSYRLAVIRADPYSSGQLMARIPQANGRRRQHLTITGLLPCHHATTGTPP
jgi:hypothetical protein